MLCKASRGGDLYSEGVADTQYYTSLQLNPTGLGLANIENTPWHIELFRKIL